MSTKIHSYSLAVKLLNCNPNGTAAHYENQILIVAGETFRLGTLAENFGRGNGYIRKTEINHTAGCAISVNQGRALLAAHILKVRSELHDAISEKRTLAEFAQSVLPGLETSTKRMRHDARSIREFLNDRISPNFSSGRLKLRILSKGGSI